jgi:hypothetical protein
MTNKISNLVACDLDDAIALAEQARKRAEFVAKWARRVQGRMSDAELRAIMPIERGKIDV